MLKYRPASHAAAPALLVALATSSGCPAGSDVTVGVGDALNLDDCAVADCKSPGTSSTAGATEARECSTSVAGSLVAVFHVDLQAKFCPTVSLGNSCQVSEGPISVAPDGSVWGLATISRNGDNNNVPDLLWLGHYSADGAELGAATVANWPILNGGGIRYEADVTALPNGEAAVLVYASIYGPNADYELDERVWVQRYRPDVTPTGSPIAVSALGVAGIASTAEGKLLLAGDAPNNKHRGVLALLTGNALEWNQTNIPSVGTGVGWGVTGMSVDAAGRTTILSVQARDSKNSDQTFGLSKFDERGTRLWNVQMAPRAEAGTYGWLAGDAAGNSSVIIEPPWIRNADGSSDAHSALYNFDPNGVARFSYKFGSVSGLTVARDTGTVFVSAIVNREMGVYALAPDGSSCRRFSYPANDRFRVAAEEVRGDSLYAGLGRYLMVPAE